MGVLWYSLLGQKHASWMRITALPFVGAVFAEALWANYSVPGPAFIGLHVVAVTVGTFAAALADILAQALVREPHLAKVVAVFAHLIR